MLCKYPFHKSDQTTIQLDYYHLYYPKEWKLGLLIRIFKLDDLFDPSNYTVTSCLSKLFTLVSSLK